MNREHPTPERLQGYFDNEVSPEERRELRVHVASCDACRAQEAAWAKLHSFVSTTVQDEARALDSDRMFAAILSGVAADTSALPTVAKSDTARKVVPIKRARRFSSVGPVAGALALAAAVMLMVYRSDPNDDNDYDSSQAHSEVVQVDFGSNAGTVFDIPLADGSSAPVVWINDDDDDDEEAQ